MSFDEAVAEIKASSNFDQPSLSSMSTLSGIGFFTAIDAPGTLGANIRIRDATRPTQSNRPGTFVQSSHFQEPMLTIRDAIPAGRRRGILGQTEAACCEISSSISTSTSTSASHHVRRDVVKPKSAIVSEADIPSRRDLRYFSRSLGKSHEDPVTDVDGLDGARPRSPQR